MSRPVEVGKRAQDQLIMRERLAAVGQLSILSRVVRDALEGQ